MTDEPDQDVAAAEQAVSFGARLSSLATDCPDEIAMVFVALDGTETEVSWAELEKRANQVGRAFAQRDVGFGDLVALALPNSLSLIAAVFGAWKLGAVPIPVRWDLPDWERDRLLAVVEAKLSIGRGDLGWLDETMAGDGSALPDVTSPNTHGICSSGSTGTPKVILMDRPGEWNADESPVFIEPWTDVERPQRILVPTTLYHTNGFATLLSLIAGDVLVVLEKFDAATVVDLIERRRITTFTATPTMLQRIADLPGVDDRDLSSLVWILQGAAMLPPSLARRWFDLIGADRVYMAYGMTEGVGLTALRGDEWLDHEGSVGRGIRETEVRVLGPEGDDLPVGEIGEIYLRSPTSGLYRYLGGSERLPTRSDGFGTAGDLGWLDDDGYLYIADRRVDLIVSGGANVYPAEVENALIEHPAIADVVVIGLADAEWGRRVHAVVEPSDPADPPDPVEVIAYAKSRLAGYKVPKTVEIIEKMPRSEATKVSRSAMVAERDG